MNIRKKIICKMFELAGMPKYSDLCLKVDSLSSKYDNLKESVRDIEGKEILDYVSEDFADYNDFDRFRDEVEREYVQGGDFDDLKDRVENVEDDLDCKITNLENDLEQLQTELTQYRIDQGRLKRAIEALSRKCDLEFRIDEILEGKDE